MNNRGFTLVELLAVILILVSISLIAVSSVTSSLERRDTKECEEQIALVKNAAKIYFSLNDGTSVTVEILKSNHYFEDDSKISRLKDTDSVIYGDNGYVFNGSGECKEKDL